MRRLWTRRWDHGTKASSSPSMELGIRSPLGTSHPTHPAPQSAIVMAHLFADYEFVVPPRLACCHGLAKRKRRRSLWRPCRRALGCGMAAMDCDCRPDCAFESRVVLQRDTASEPPVRTSLAEPSDRLRRGACLYVTGSTLRARCILSTCV